MKDIAEIIRISEQGVSQPFLCRDADGVCYWCKGKTSGIRTVQAEWVCAGIARLLGLPVPDASILRVPDGLYEQWAAVHASDVPILSTPSNPYVFASMDIPNCKDATTGADLDGADARLLARILLFDRAIRNTDRVDDNSNLLVSPDASLHIIDHNNAFDPSFDPVGFMRSHILRESYAAFADDAKAWFRDAFRAIVTRDAIEGIWHEMPAPWTDDSAGLTLEDVCSIIFHAQETLP